MIFNELSTFTEKFVKLLIINLCFIVINACKNNDSN